MLSIGRLSPPAPPGLAAGRASFSVYHVSECEAFASRFAAGATLFRPFFLPP